MTYIKSIFAGIILLIGFIALFTFGSEWLMHFDARWAMGEYPFISLLTMLVVFLAGFLWQFRQISKHRASSPR